VIALSEGKFTVCCAGNVLPTVQVVLHLPGQVAHCDNLQAYVTLPEDVLVLKREKKFLAF
jgi:hypothetical protein